MNAFGRNICGVVPVGPVKPDTHLSHQGTSMYDAAYRAGRRYDQFLAAAAVNRDLWQAVDRRARVAPDTVARARAVPGRWRLLVLADDWCGDAVNILPVVARLADAVDDLELRIVGREEVPGLMDRHLTNGGRAIPVFILLDEAGTCRGWWGPRPTELQSWFEVEGRSLHKDTRYRELRRWYARDRGAAIAAEIAVLLECGESGEHGCHHARHCPSQAA